MGLTIDSIINELGNVSITIDGYVPIDIKILDTKTHPPLYWRVGDGKKSLLEFAVLPENRLLSAITLVMIEPDSIHKTESLPVSFLGCSHGLPVINTDLWKCSESDDFSQRFVDDFSLGIQVVMSSESMLLIIGENKKTTNWIRCGDNFFLGIDDERNIVNIFLSNLTQKEIECFFDLVG